ncbi:phage portal protein [Azospirillum thermophilum]|uniref:Phage portal protein n=1 Tax=Azospirillum thermophilum TaxID=2202148 RepID=A0A2S2D1P4_9PROT|nr:phage portal protein [Azospirillum thermophilum]AWK90357.1 phage portal protein [Azospirillum thermophilum]
MRGLFGSIAGVAKSADGAAASGAAGSGGWRELINTRSAVGIAVNQANAMKVSTVFACVNIPAEDVARATPRLYRKLPDRTLDDGRLMPGGRVEITDHPIAERFRRPNDYQDWYQFCGMVERCLGLKSNAYIVNITDGRGNPAAWVPMNPDRVTILEATDGSVFYSFAPSGNVERSLFARLFGRTGSLRVPAENVLHLQDVGFSLLYGSPRIGFAADAIGLSLAQEQQAAAWMRNGARPAVVLVTEQELSEPAARRIKAEWEELNAGVAKSGGTAVLEQGLKPETLSLSSTDLEFLASRNFQVEDICRFFRMPPHKVAKLERATNGNVAAQDSDYLDNTLSPRFTRWEKRLDFHFRLWEQQLEVDFDLSDLFRADPGTRMQTARQGVAGGILTQNEARWVFDRSLPPVPGGDTLLAPTNMAATGSHASGSAPDGAGRPPDSERMDKSAGEVAQRPFDLVTKGHEDQPRDKNGRWAKVAGISGTRLAAWFEAMGARLQGAVGSGKKARFRHFVRRVGTVRPDIERALAAEGITLQRRGVTIGSEEVASMTRPAKGTKNVSPATFSALKEILKTAPAYLDVRTGNLIYAVRQPGGTSFARITVALNYNIRVPKTSKRSRTEIVTNAVWSASSVEERVLSDLNSYLPLKKAR